MRKHKLIIKDSDDFWSHVDYVDEEGSCHITIKEGDLPISPPIFTYEVVEE